jgi:phenylalanyl-tRNA synthetase beta chain
VNLDLLVAAAKLVPQDQQISDQPAMGQDMNFVVPEALTWFQLSEAVRQAAGELLESMQYKETYRDEQQDGQGRKRLLFHVILRASDRTLTKDEAEDVRASIVAAMKPLDGQLIGG